MAEDHNEKMLAQSRKSKGEHMPTIMRDVKKSTGGPHMFQMDSATKFKPVNPYSLNPPDKRLGTAPINQFGRPRTAAMLLETAAGVGRPNTGTQQGFKAF